MFIGHYAPAFIAAALPRTPRLATLFVAAQLVDLAFFAFVLLGVEHMRIVPGVTVMNGLDLYDMRYTHSLVGTLGWAAGFALALRLFGRDWRAAWIGAGVVASHWLLDLLVHAPDLTIAGIGQRYGYALWDQPAVAMPLELGVTALAITFYATRTRARDWRGSASLAALTLALIALQAIDWLGAKPDIVVDPVPASFPLTALAAYAVLTALAWWVDATRETNTGPRIVAL